MAGEKIASAGRNDKAGTFEIYANQLRADLEELGFTTPYPGQLLTGISPIVAYFNYLRDPRSFKPPTDNAPPTLQTSLGAAIQSWIPKANPTNPFRQSYQYRLCPRAEIRFINSLRPSRNLHLPLIIMDGNKVIGVMKPGGGDPNGSEPTVYSFTHDGDLGMLPNTIGSFALRLNGEPGGDLVDPEISIKSILPTGPDAYTISKDALLRYHEKLRHLPHRLSTLAIPPEVRDEASDAIDKRTGKRTIPAGYPAAQLFRACQSLLDSGRTEKADFDLRTNNFEPATNRFAMHQRRSG